MEENKKEHPIIVKYNNLIKDAMKAHEKIKLNTYKLVKARMLEYKTGAADQDGNYPVLDEKTEIQILNKMVKELQGDIKTRLSVGRTEEASEFTEQMNYIKELLPKMASEDEVKTVIEKYIADNGNYTQKEMGKVIGFVRSQFKLVDGAMVSNMVKSYIA